VIINEDDDKDDPPSDFATSFLSSDSFREEGREKGLPSGLHLTDNSIGSHCYMHGCMEHFIPLSDEHLASGLTSSPFRGVLTSFFCSFLKLSVLPPIAGDRA
jgi:hypothetical protein